MRSRDVRGGLLETVERIERYTTGMDPAALAADQRTADAVERCLQRISEAAARLGDAAPQLAPGLPWAKIRGIGNHLRHAYDRIDPGIIWNIVAHDLRVLRVGCEAALAGLPSEDDG